MRIYLPATAAHLRAAALGSSTGSLLAHAATPALSRALPEEDEEGLEVSASLCAADASLVLLAEPEAEGLADRRVVIAADVDGEHVRELAVEGDVLPGTVEIAADIPWDDVAALLVDEAEAEADVRSARCSACSASAVAPSVVAARAEAVSSADFRRSFGLMDHTGVGAADRSPVRSASSSSRSAIRRRSRRSSAAEARAARRPAPTDTSRRAPGTARLHQGRAVRAHTTTRPSRTPRRVQATAARWEAATRRRSRASPWA